MGPSVSMNVGPMSNLQTTDISSPIFDQVFFSLIVTSLQETIKVGRFIVTIRTVPNLHICSFFQASPIYGGHACNHQITGHHTIVCENKLDTFGGRIFLARVYESKWMSR